MFAHKALFHSFVAMAVSAAIAFPPITQAQEAVAPAPSSSGPALPVILETVKTDNGVSVIAAAPIPLEQETGVVTEAAVKNPKNTILAISGVQDPDLLAAAKTGNLSKMEVIEAAKGDADVPVLNDQSLPLSLRAKLRDKLDKLRAYTAENKWGILFAVSLAATIGGIESSYVFIESSRIDAGIKAFMAISFLNAFQVICAHRWAVVLEMGAFFTLGWMAERFGKRIDIVSKRMLETSGKFLTSFGINSAVLSYILYSAGTFTGWEQVALLGAISCNDVMDSTIEARVKRGMFSDIFQWRFVVGRLLTFEALGQASLWHVQGAWTTAAVITGAAFLYDALGEFVEKSAFGRFVGRTVSTPIRSLASRAWHAIRRFGQSRADSVCENALSATYAEASR